MLADYEPLVDEWAVRDWCGCGRPAVVSGDRKLCFGCAFVDALTHDPEAIALAIVKVENRNRRKARA